MKIKADNIRFKRFIIRMLLYTGLSVWFTPVFCSSGDTLFAGALHPYGRYTLTKDGNVELISSAVHFGFSFSGSQCILYAFISDPAGHNYLQYTLDGVYQKRLKISGAGTQRLAIDGIENGKHIIWIYKATEATTGPIFIEKIFAKNVVALKVPDKPLIEFIGNSITCGAAADPSETPCGTGEYHDQHNAYYAYGPMVSRTLNANFILSSVSGIGIYRNWNSLVPTMPQVYEKTDFEGNSVRYWNFTSYRPRIVSIALGTNDFSDGDGKNPRLPFDSVVFVNEYLRFVKQVESKYPDAQIALLSSPMLRGDKRERLQNCLTAVKDQMDRANQSGISIALFFFEPMQARGCSGHPSVEDHAILAEELAPFFKKLLDRTIVK
jgi:Carbohydrate esterase 2 N-terminal/GDSL-like Lipase/Acylhydrolase family